MTWAFLLIGAVISANSILGYQLAIGRAKRRGTHDAVTDFVQGAFPDAFRHWVMLTGLCLVAGGVIGAEEGPGAFHGIMTVAAASFGIALPFTYVAGLFYARRAEQLINGGQSSSKA